MKDKEGIPLSFYYWIHCRIYKQSIKGMIQKEYALLVFRQCHNIPTELCKIYIEELRRLGLLKFNGDVISVETPKKSEEELIFEVKKKLNLL